jgi:hypothetical protein
MWPPAAIIAAARRWFEETETAPSSHAWGHVAQDHPARGTVLRVFGSWARMYRAAGITPPKFGRRQHWTRDTIADAMIEWSVLHGRWPRYRDWRAATPDYPHGSQIYLLFSTWDEAIDYARGHDRKTMVHSAPVADALREYIGPNGSAGVFADLLNVDVAPIHKLLAGKRPSIDRDAADRILTAIDRPDVLVDLEPVAA